MSAKPTSLPGTLATWMLMFTLLSLYMVACTSAPTANTTHTITTSLPTTTVQTTTTIYPAGTLLYQANWSRGLDSWQQTGGWHVTAGYLERQGGNQGTLTIPYQPPVSNYAFEVRFQIVQILNDPAFFMIVARRQAGRDGYQTGWRQGLFGYIDPTGSDVRASTFSSDYVVRDIWHTYRIEVRDNDLQMFDNGVFLGEMHSEQTNFLSNGPLSLNSSRIILRVSQIRLLTL